ncbi:MAG: phosphoribosylglycinamide formyltransferase [Fibrobacterota bacterium]|nr:phosphoribosylglycinamide formyltransferase [Fibrobacterota bacterium]
MARYRIGVFASGGGSNLQAIMDRIRSGELPADLAFVLSNNSKSGALARARQFGTQAFHVSAFTEGGEDKAVARMIELAKVNAIDLLVLAGYMKKVPDPLLDLMKNRVVNVHPALLPAFGGEGFYGHKVHEGVVARGCQFTGMSIHMVNQVYDEGQIVLQRIISVVPGSSRDAVAADVLKLEHAYFWQVVKAFAVGEIKPTSSDEAGKAVDLGRFLDRFRTVD